MGNKLAIAALALAVCSAGFAGFTLAKYRALEEELVVRPKVVVLDLQGEIFKAVKEGRDTDQVAAEIAEVGKKLVDAGYVVLDQRSVYAYDDSLKVNP